MSDIIKKLPQNIIMKIAAGEVVDRPASIVKEMVENSIDANAKAITVEIRDGGISYIRIVDNGDGIKENMLKLAFDRHSTSKIDNEDDLFNIHTLGFRGEALSSIAAVSKIDLSTKHKTSKSGVNVLNEGGLLKNIKPAAISCGTSIVVKDLFYNTPVRLKFLKKASIEASSVSELMMRLILSHPEISFRFVNNGKTMFHSVGDGKLESAILRIYDRNTLNKMKKISGSHLGVVVKGYVGVMDLARGNRQHQTFFVNGRYFKDDRISRAVEKACAGLYTVAKFPMCVLFIEVPNNTVDVNVHPNKLEVRFQNNNDVKEAVEKIIYESVNEISINSEMNLNYKTDNNRITEQISDKVSSADEINENIKEIINNQTPNKNVLNDSSSYSHQVDINKQIFDYKNSDNNNLYKDDVNINNTNTNSKTEKELVSAKTNRQKNKYKNGFEVSIKDKQEGLIKDSYENDLKKFIFVGTLFNSFIIIQYEEKYIMIDQHAAHERINYERMMKAFSENIFSQSLLTPILVKVNAIDCELIRNHIDDLYEAGFDVSIFDDTSVAIRAVPLILGEPMEAKDCLYEVIDSWNKSRKILNQEAERKKITQMACKHAIKAGQAINKESIIVLVNDIFNNKIPPTCPHGRPIFIEYQKRDLYKAFKRIQ